ncbi:CdaR family protein [Peptoniphilus genitalis]|uniref:CdaR family protein n=1 Tax=Peptoniphilus genitalis TaxID=3036303 RepID=A0ABY4TMS7_9FIRM|nr:CdaR family protein [Peptoniphilus sp. SAHP1]URN41735.1 CdaR family protein [Peptoniphilus sp. SAHP1]
MKKINFRNDRSLMLKVMSLIFAIILWSYVKGEANFLSTSNFKNIEVTYDGLSQLKEKNLIIISPKESTVDVKLQGYNSYMRNVTRDGIVAKVDVSKLTEGEHSVPINVSYIDLGISVTNTTPRRIPFKIDKVLEEKAEANIVFLNKLEKGLTLGDLNKKVNVVVKGPSTYVNKINKIDAYIDLSEITETTSIEAEIYAYDDAGKIIKEVEISPATIKVDLPILKSKTVPIKLKFNENTSKNIVTSDFSIEPSSVTIRGNSDVIDSIDFIETRPINLHNFKAGNDLVKLKLPDKVTLVDENIDFRLKQVVKED